MDGLLEVLATGADSLRAPAFRSRSSTTPSRPPRSWPSLHPGDDELAAAGLVHDIGHLLPEGSDETHAADAARAVRRALGERVAGIVALHIEAKRYLVATEDGYGGVLTNDSVVSLQRQGGALFAKGHGGLPGRAVGGRRGDAAPRRRQRQGRRVGGPRPPELGAALAGPHPPRPASRGLMSVDIPISGHCDARFLAVREEFVPISPSVGRSAPRCTSSSTAQGGRPGGRLGGSGEGGSLGPRHAGGLLLGRQGVRGAAGPATGRRRAIALDDPIAASGPSSPPPGKEGATLRHALCHRAGVPAIRGR